MTVQPKALSEITHQAISLLSRELGVANTIRFINQFTTGYGDYTEERKELFEELTLEQILSGIEADRGRDEPC